MKRILKVVAIIVAVLIVLVIAIPFFIDANTFKPKLESELTDALGRQVTVGNISLSLLSGGVSAENIAIADDPQYSKSAFVQAKSLKVGVELMPLIFSRVINITDLTLNEPQISLVKSPNGDKWNFSSLGTKTGAAESQPAPSGTAAQSGTKANPSTSTSKPAPTNPQEGSAPASPSADHPNLSVAKLNVNNGRLTVSQANSTVPQRVYDKVNAQITNFSFTSSFPFSLSADLPSGGTLKLTGNTGPIDVGNAEQTPVDAKLNVQNMNVATSGFIDPAAGIAGVADLDGTVKSDGHEAKVEGTLKVSNLKVVAKGSPAGKPVEHEVLDRT